MQRLKELFAEIDAERLLMAPVATFLLFAVIIEVMKFFYNWTDNFAP